MKYPNEIKKIFEYTSAYINNLQHNIKQFKIFCEDIANANPYSIISSSYMNIHKNIITMQCQLNEIKDKFFSFKQNCDNKIRPDVLYPYEKQAIYQYLNKFDFKKNCYKKYGCMYAEKILKDGKEIITIGLSVCNDKDEFSRNIALNLAKKRAREYPARYYIRVTPRPEKFSTDNALRIPYKWVYEEELVKFVKRCIKWFKKETIIYPNNIDFVEFPKKKKGKSNKITNKKIPF